MDTCSEVGVPRPIGEHLAHVLAFRFQLVAARAHANHGVLSELTVLGKQLMSKSLHSANTEQPVSTMMMFGPNNTTNCYEYCTRC